MTKRRLLLSLLAAAALGASAAPADAARPLKTSIHDSVGFNHRGSATFQKVRRAGATQVRLILHWVSVANGVEPPANPADWDNPAYNWEWFDNQVIEARRRGLVPFVTITSAPKWATTADDHVTRPNRSALAQFARAAAIRYSGTKRRARDGALLPRVRHWQIWNEPNRGYSLAPQYAGGRIAAADWYRGMVRQVGAAIRRVNPANRIVAGGLAPIGRPTHAAPLAFMRRLLCVSRTLRRTCNLRRYPVRFDVWAHHPYTLGWPTRRGPGVDDVMISGLPKMRKLLRRAIRLGHVRGRGAVQLWATEFSWDSAPEDPKGAPAWLHARWTSEALYRMWKAGVSSVTWFLIQDAPTCSRYQSGFFNLAGEEKHSLTAFRFPLVAFRSRRGVQIWGRTPSGRRGTVQLMVRRGGAWRPYGRVRTNVHGIFQRSYGRKKRKGQTVLARFKGESSLPFSLTRPRNVAMADPFGVPAIEPHCNEY